MLFCIFCRWFFGKTLRKDAEKMLQSPECQVGSFLIRESEYQHGCYTLSVRKNEDNISHYRIRQLEDSSGFYITRKHCAESLQDLVQHYSQNAGGLPTKLTQACSKDPPCIFGLSCNPEITRSSISIKKNIGVGQFGEVWEGNWNGMAPVAVKVLKSGVHLNSEIQIWKKMRHVNLIQLYAIFAQEEPVWVITELMKNGSLLEYLRNGKGKTLELPQLIDIAAQVASGMVYLEGHDFVHRQLAARKVLVGERNSVKVSLAFTDAEEESDITHQIRWTAPEAALYSRFTTKSDVWSFGILLYELVTYGCVPYEEMTNTQVLKAVQQGYRIALPNNLQSLSSIMMDCWRENPSDRPTFETLYFTLDDEIILCGEGSYKVGVDVPL